MDGHSCDVSPETQRALQAADSSAATSKTPFSTARATVPVSSDSNRKELLMGHGLQSGRSVTFLDDSGKAVLEKQFLLGVEWSSNRKCVLEMVEECGKVMPKLMAPAVHEINSWLSSRLSKEKKATQTPTDPSAAQAKKRNKTVREKRQDEAAVMKKDQKDCLQDITKKHLLIAKYLDILLIKDDVTRIVTAVTFSVERSIWVLSAKPAKQDKYDDRIYIADPDSVLATISIDVKSRKGQADYIKAFNNQNKPLI